MLKDNYKGKTSELESKSTYSFLKNTLNNPYSYNFGKKETNSLERIDKLHRINNMDDKI